MARPAFTVAGGSFSGEIELPAGARNVTFQLHQPGGVRCSLTFASAGAGRSLAWPELPSLQVTHLTFNVPPTCAPRLYNLVLEFDTALTHQSQRQVNAVSVMDPARHAALAAGTAQPRFVVIADPQIGDPRAFAQAAQEGDVERIPAIVDGTFGVTVNGAASTVDRWKAVVKALAEAKALEPDFVLVAGDLGFGQLVPGSYAAEFEEIWAVLSEADVPLILAPGNHDGYVSNGQDGFAYWRAYFGPTYTFLPTVPGTHVLVLNTYDFSEMDRLGASYGVSSWGGQVRETQLAWIGQTLQAAPAGRIIAVSHHSPSWRQDPWAPVAEGLPVAEQVERGALTFTSTDQGWIGRNRLELRDLLREHDVEMLFAGHTHHDRVARDDGTGRIVGTTQTLKVVPEGFDPRALHYFTREDVEIGGYSQADLADLVREGAGPLYVDTTTTMSETDQYWGYRAVEIAYTPGGALDLTRFGYPLTQAELDALARHPEIYNVAHAELGLFSTPLHVGS